MGTSKCFRWLHGVLLVTLWLSLSGVESQRGFLNAIARARNPSDAFRLVMLELIGRSAENSRNLRVAHVQKRLQLARPNEEPFFCNVTGFRSPERPKSVHQLRPGDIDVIAAMGDSLTAGNGAAATQVFQVFVENRGISWSIGGQGNWRTYLTLPNILKEFNPLLFGYSQGDGISSERASQFNVGEIGGISRDLLHMANVLVTRIRADKRVDFYNDWKLVTLMIGCNDMCAFMCYEDPYKAPEEHKNNIMVALDYLQENLPRTIINLVNVPNLRLIQDFKGRSSECQTLAILECPCLFGPRWRKMKEDFTKIMRRMQLAENELVSSGRYDVKDDFTVVVQPFTFNLAFPEVHTKRENVTDFTYLSHDCFHFSQKGYARATNALWNNMLEAVGKKSDNWDVEFTRFLCPSEEHPFICTARNSPGCN